MNKLLYLTILTVLMNSFLLHALAAQDACLLTSTECQCSSSVPSGTCLRSQGDGTCLLSSCSEGYRCDCFGYEKCAISKCGKHIAVGTGIPSETVPFSCEMAPGAGICTNAVDILDTVSAARNAESHAASSNDEAIEDEADAMKQIEEIQAEKKAISEVLKEVELVADDLTDAELADIERDAEQVEDAVEEAAMLVVEVVRSSRKGAKALRDSRKHKRVALRADRMKKEKKEQLEKEEARSKQSGVNHELRERLRRDIKILDDETKRNARASGLKAKEGREMRKQSKEMKKKAQEVTKKSKAAGERCMEKVQRSLGKAKGRGGL